MTTSDWLRRSGATASEHQERRGHARPARRRILWTSLLIAASVAAPFTGAIPAEAATTVCLPLQGCYDVPGAENVALNAVVVGAGGVLCTMGSGPQNAVDGAASNIYTDKWCVRPSWIDPRTPRLTIPLVRNGAAGYEVFKIVVKHAGAAGENPAYNTRGFTLRLTSVARPGWEHVHPITSNTDNETTFAYLQTTQPLGGFRNITQVEVIVDNPTQGIDQATRIYEVEVWAVPNVF
jgi:hypothetical protein